MLIIVFSLLSFINIFSQDGFIDTSFNTGTGIDSGGFGIGVRSIEVQPDGKILVGGAFVAFNGTNRMCIARLNTNGTLDTSFNPGTGADYTIKSIVLQSDGKIIIGGAFSKYNGVSRNGVARLNSDGSLDTTFNPGSGINGTVTTDFKPFVYSILPQTQDRILIAGNFLSYNGTDKGSIARLYNNGVIDNTFDPPPHCFACDKIYYSMALQPNGKIILPKRFASRLNIDGSIDNTFQQPNCNPCSYSSYVKIQSDGKILIAGGSYRIEGVWHNNIIRLLNSDNLSVNDLSDKKTISIFPNPVKNTLNIQTEGKLQKAEIYSANGQLVKTFFTGNINVEKLPKGNYIVKITTDKGVETEKFIKE